MTQITDLTLLGTTPADGDLLIIRDVSDTTDKPNGTDKKIALSTLMDAAPGNKQNNLTASAGPTVDDDAGIGYEVGSLWYVTTGAESGSLFILVDDTEGAAVWVETTDTPLSFTNSIENSTGGVQLVNDEASPGTNQVYGTDSGGNKGWFAAQGLTYFDEQLNVTSPNDTREVALLDADSASTATDIDVALIPKGLGAFMLALPDSTATGGNKRGNRAIDLQTNRSAAAEVASGTESVITHGRNNTSSGTRSLTGGTGNTASAANATAIGEANEASATEAFAIGNNASADLPQQFAQGGDAFTNPGDAQFFRVVGGVETTDGSATDLFLGGGFSRIQIRQNRDWDVLVRIVARESGGSEHASFQRRVLLTRDSTAGSTAIVGSSTPDPDITSGGATGWSVSITANTSFAALDIQVTGDVGTTIRWVASIEVVEVVHS